MQNERGGILLELAIFTILLLLFSAGTLEVHRSLQRRQLQILQLRNQLIAKARQGSPLATGSPPRQKSP